MLGLFCGFAEQEPSLAELEDSLREARTEVERYQTEAAEARLAVGELLARQLDPDRPFSGRVMHYTAVPVTSNGTTMLRNVPPPSYGGPSPQQHNDGGIIVHAAGGGGGGSSQCTVRHYPSLPAAGARLSGSGALTADVIVRGSC
jgi:hypothetical protein